MNLRFQRISHGELSEVDKLMVVLVCSLCVLFAFTAQGVETPTSRPLDSLFRQEISQESRYFLQHRRGVIAASGKWLVFPLEHYLFPRATGESGTSTVVGVVTVHVATGRALYLPNPHLETRSQDTATPYWCDLVVLDDDQIGVQFFGCTKARPLQQPAWKWNLTTQVVSDMGQWPLGVLQLAGAVDTTAYTISTEYNKAKKWTGCIAVSAPETRTTLCFDPTQVSSPGAARSSAVAPAIQFLSGDISKHFIEFHSRMGDVKSDFSILCRDITTGLATWRVSQQELQRACGSNPMLMTPLVGTESRRTKNLVFAVHPDGADQPDGFVSIDATTGRVIRCRTIPGLETANIILVPPVVAPSGRYVAFAGTDATLAPGHYCDCVKLIDLVLGTQRLYHFQHGGVMTDPVGFLDDNRLVTADNNAIWVFDIRADWKAKEVFRLVP